MITMIRRQQCSQHRCAMPCAAYLLRQRLETELGAAVLMP
jgi:hypothetical protein